MISQPGDENHRVVFFATHRKPARMSGACELVMSRSSAGSLQHTASREAAKMNAAN